MKIIFICGSLEPGRDGVGDYTRRLAGELIRQGHFAAILSLNDKYALSRTREVQQSEGVDVPVLRLPYGERWKQRVADGKAYIEEFNPDWLSLQFVIFGFHPKGLPLGLGNHLAAIGKGRQWHIMFHELWVQGHMPLTVKFYLWARIQRLIIKSLIAKLRPIIIHTHTRFYQYQLSQLGYNAHHLPLFGNVPNLGKDDNQSHPNQLKLINFVLFGRIYSNTPVGEFTMEAASYAVSTGVDISITILGRCGKNQEAWINACNSAGIVVNVLGEQSTVEISKTLNESSFGISTTPLALIERSGTVAAMLEHDLLTICVPCSWQPEGFTELKTPAGILLYQQGNLKHILNAKFDQVIKNNISIITRQMTTELLDGV